MTQINQIEPRNNVAGGRLVTKWGLQPMDSGVNQDATLLSWIDNEVNEYRHDSSIECTLATCRLRQRQQRERQRGRGFERARVLPWVLPRSFHRMMHQHPTTKAPWKLTACSEQLGHFGDEECLYDKIIADY